MAALVTSHQFLLSQIYVFAVLVITVVYLVVRRDLSSKSFLTLNITKYFRSHVYSYLLVLLFFCLATFSKKKQRKKCNRREIWNLNQGCYEEITTLKITLIEYQLACLMASASAAVQIRLFYVSSAEISTSCWDCTFWFQGNVHNHCLLTSSSLNSNSLLCPPCNCAQMALADTRIAYQPEVDKHAGVLVWKL